MELITAQTLWKEYNPRTLPLGESVLSLENRERYTIKHVYFNGEATADGCTRIYARLYIPASIPSGASVVLMNDIETPFDTTYINMLIDCGYTVIVPDYAGKRDGKGMFTIYPDSLSEANYYTRETGFYKLPTNPKTSCWYVYTTIMLRCYVYLESQTWLDKNRISFFGVKRGGLQVYKAAFVMPEAACAVTLFNTSYIPDGPDLNSNEAMIYNACLSNSQYTPITKIPLYAVESSNNRENSLFKTSDLIKVANDKVRFYIAERSDNTLSTEQRKNVMSFMNEKCFKHNVLPAPPEIDAKNMDRSLYYEVKVDAPDEIEDIKLYYSYGNMTGTYRNWSTLSLEKVSENEYITKADVYVLKAETSAFVSVKYTCGVTLSSEIVSRVPYMMGITSKEIVHSRLVYDVDMGTDDWLISSELGEGEIYMKEDGNGIEGVTSSINSLTTLKIGDIHTCGSRDSLLQLLVFSKTIQTLRIKVTCKSEDGYKSYSCSKHIESYDEWAKLTLSVEEFKSPEGSMDGWDEAVSITVNSESELLINTLLWI